jgi:hypothetical protein
MVDRAKPTPEVLTAATFEPVRVRRASGARARLVTAAWVAGLVGIAGLAVVGRLTETGVPTVAVAPNVAVASTPELDARPPGTSAPLPAYPPGMHHLASIDRELIVLTSPALGDPTITAAELIVQGFLQADAASLRVSLETDWYPIEEATVIPALAFGERPGPTRHAQFLVRFALSEPRPTIPMSVRVVAFDRDGQWIANVLRPFRLGPIERPSLGDDGLLGGLVFSGG